MASSPPVSHATAVAIQLVQRLDQFLSGHGHSSPRPVPGDWIEFSDVVTVHGRDPVNGAGNRGAQGIKPLGPNSSSKRAGGCDTSTSCPTSCSSAAAVSTARTQAGSVLHLGSPESDTKPIRSLLRPFITVSADVSSSLGARHGSPGSLPAKTSKILPASRTDLVRTPLVTWPNIGSPASGAWLTRPRLGLSPTRPLCDAGMRSEPPPSLPWPTGTIPDATAAADPPEEPPGVWPVCQGFLVAPYALFWVSLTSPNSGTLVRPSVMNPAALNRRTMEQSWSDTCSRCLSARLP